MVIPAILGWRALPKLTCHSFLSSGLDAEVLEAAGLGEMGTFLAITSNGEVGENDAQRFRFFFSTSSSASFNSFWRVNAVTG